MPYRVNGQAVATKSQRVLHAAGWDGEAGAAAGGGAFVTMSAAIAPLDDQERSVIAGISRDSDCAWI